MVINVDSLIVTRFHCTIDSRLEILPASISQDFLQFSGEPNLHLFFLIVTFDVGGDSIECRLILYDALFIYKSIC